MSAAPGGINTEQQPPMIVPLRHFLVGLGFLVFGAALGVSLLLEGPLANTSLVHVHLLLVGWVCLTIMGAMTQFVPVWSGVAIHSQRLANWQLRLVVVGLVGFITMLSTARMIWTPVFGVVMLAGFWIFVYNIGQTLWSADALDITERHFAVALGFFVLVTILGPLLAFDLATGILPANGLTHGAVLKTHATLAVFGAILTTILGALYQLGTMFTQTELHGLDLPLRRFEEPTYPTGVALLAAGRLADSTLVARVGGLLLLAGLAAVAIILARKLYEMQVTWTPMHRRYAVVPPAIVLWVALTAPVWVREPLAMSSLLGAENATHLLLLGVVGFVVLGTLYHIVPFVVWVHRYSDRLGFEKVPIIDDLYDDRIAALDLFFTLVGTVSLVLWESGFVVQAIGTAGGFLVICGVLLFVTNIGLVLYRHSPHSHTKLLLGRSVATNQYGESESEPDERKT